MSIVQRCPIGRSSTIQNDGNTASEARRFGDTGELLHAIEVLAVAAVAPIGTRFGIDASRPRRRDRRGDIVGSEPAREDNRHTHARNDAAADGPVVRPAESLHLDKAVKWFTA